MTAVALMEQIAKGTAPVILDVRSQHEFSSGHIPGALHVPFWKIASESRKLSAFREKPIVVYCGHGPRAYIAGAVLRRRGFQSVAYLKGHMRRWRSLKFPVEVD
jgi:rhodanese-related sulfurtransferase